jgi:hypothetical protein
MKDIQKIKEFFSKPMEAITTAYEAKGEYFKPSIRKDKSNPNFLYVDIAYPAGSDVLSIGGSKTMGGQDREAGAAKALSMGNMIAKKLQTKYNIEDIDVSDLKDGKVEVFAVSDDFIKMASPSIDDETKSTIPTKMSYYPSALYKEAEEEETAVDMAKKQLDALGVKYELGNKFKPFKTIYKPTGKSDKFYDTFNDIVDLFNLGNAVKSSMSESLTAGYPHRKTSGEGFEKIVIVEPMDDATRERMIRRFEAEGWDAKPNFGGGITAIKKTTMEEAKFRSGLLSGKDFINAKLSKYPKAVSKINQLIDMIGENKFTIEMAEWIFDFFNNASFESPVNEAKEEDKVDTITMDVPLFIRMLEYSREDAAEDMDLHDVTEKAISLGKERGILQMDDYDEIIDTTEKVNEVNLKQAKLSSSEYQKAKKLKNFKASDWKWNADEDLYTKVTEATDYMKRRKAEDDYATKKPKQPAYTGKTDYMKRREKGLEEKIDEALNSINEELCPAGKAYIKRRQAAGEKSSAYLSGRGVKVCKGQMSGKAKKKK